MEPENKQDALSGLRNQIKIQLQLCDDEETPTVCAMKETTEGYDEIERLIIQKVLYGEDSSISNAIVEIENEYNPNSYAE